MADPEPLARLDDKSKHAVEVLLAWVAEGRTGALTFHFEGGVPQVVEGRNRVDLGDTDDRSLAVVD